MNSTLAVDINDGLFVGEIDAFPRLEQVVPLGPLAGSVLFTASSVPTGREWFVSDGTPAGTELQPELLVGTGSRNPVGAGFLPDGRFLTQAVYEGAGAELALVDTVHQTTRLLGDLLPGPLPSRPRAFTSWAGRVWFHAETAADGLSLYSSDGSGGGTLRADAFSSSGDNLNVQVASFPTSFGLFYTLRGSSTAGLYYRPDAFAPATLVLSLVGAADAVVERGIEAGGRFYFDGPSGVLYASDGTAAGTAPVSDAQGRVLGDALVLSGTSGALDVRASVPALGGLPATGRELFRVPAGAPAQLVIDLVPGPGDGLDAPVAARAGAELVFLAADTSGPGEALYRTDGTAAGTALIVGGLDGAALGPRDLAVQGDRVLTVQPGLNPTNRVLLAVDLDGNNPATLAIVLAADFNGFIGVPGAQLFAGAPAGSPGAELWRTDGTPSGTLLAADIGVDVQTGSANVTTVHRAGDRLLVNAGNPAGQVPETYVSDGTAEGTVLLGGFAGGDAVHVLDVLGEVPGGSILAGLHPHQLARLGHDGQTFELLSDDLFAELPFQGFRGSGVLYRGRLHFMVEDAENWKLWATDGTPSGTELVFTWEPPVSGDGMGPVVHAGKLLFGAAGHWLYVSDGTDAGTKTYFSQSPALLSKSVGDLLVGGDGALYVVRPGGSILRASGAPATAVVTGLKTTGDGPSGTRRRAVPLRDGIAFLADAPEGFTRKEVVYYDGLTGSVSVLNRDSSSGALLFNEPEFLESSGGRLFVQVFAEGLNGVRKLWVSGGEPGDAQVTNHNLASVGLPATTAGETGGGVFMLASGFGVEPFWLVPGTANVQLFADISPGPASSGSFSSPGRSLFGRFYLGADDGILGRELHSLPFAAAGTWMAEVVGAGCGGSGALGFGGFPQMGASGAAGPGDVLLAEVSNALPGAPALLFGGGGTARVALDATCTQWIQSAALRGTVTVDGSGRAATPLAVPAIPALAGALTRFQWVVADPGPGGWLGAFALSDALEVLVGP